MKHFLAVLILIGCACMLFACNSKTKTVFTGEAYTQNHGTERLCETDSAYFIAKPHESKSQDSATLYLYYCDKAGLTGFSPYCNRAECSHSDTDCNAYLGICKAIAAYDGQILYVTDNMSGRTSPKLMRMGIGGMSHEEICEITPPESEGVYSCSYMNYYFHYNHLIYSVSFSNVDEEEASYYALYALDINAPENAPIEFLKVNKGNPDYSRLSVGGGTLLGGTRDTIYVASYSLFECSLDTGKYTAHKFPSDAEINPHGEYINGKILYFKENSNKKTDLYEYDPATEKEVKLNTDKNAFPIGGIIAEEYVYIVYPKITYTGPDGNVILSLGDDMECGLYVYRHNGELVKFVKEQYPMRQSYLMNNDLLCFENKGEYALTEDIELRFPMYSFDITDLDGEWRVIGGSDRAD